jgi:hypothetical protein
MRDSPFKESTTYQAVVREGIVEGEQRVLLLLGEAKFGPADDVTREVIQAIYDPGMLEELLVRLLDAESWQELLPRPPTASRDFGLKEYLTYQAGLRQGRVEEARRLLLIAGEAKFGPAEAVFRATIKALDDLPRLEVLALRLVSVENWQELLPPPPQGRRRRRNAGD